MSAATAKKGTPPETGPASAPAQKEPDKVVPIRKVEQLGPARLVEAEFCRRAWVATAHLNTEPGDLEVPTYWAHVANHLKPWDRIEVRTDDMSWYAECVVLDACKTEAAVKVLGAWILTPVDIERLRQDSDLIAYKVTHRGPYEMWSVVRKVDNQVVHSGSATEAGAFTWLKERLKAGI